MTKQEAEQIIKDVFLLTRSFVGDWETFKQWHSEYLINRILEIEE